MKFNSRKILPFFGLIAVAFCAIAVCLFCGSVEAGLLLSATPVIAGTVSTERIEGIADEIGRNIIDPDAEAKVLMLRADIAPLDTMIRQMGSSSTDSQEIQWFDGDLDLGFVYVASAVNQNPAGSDILIPLTPETFKLCGESEILQYYDTSIERFVGLLIISKDKTNGTISCKVIGGAGTNGDQAGTSGIEADKELHFTGVAKHELDAQTSPLQRFPEMYNNYCQIQMAQIEQGFYDKKQKKIVDYGLMQFKSNALIRFRLGCERTVLFGIKKRTENINGDTVFAAGGLENYVGWNMKYVPMVDETQGGLGLDLINEMGEKLFASISGSNERVMFYSPAFMRSLLKNIEFKKIMAEAETKLVYGIECKRINTGFGFLNLTLHKGFSGDRAGQAAIVDLERVRMRYYMKMRWRQVDLIGSGQSLAEAQVLEERACAEFRSYPSHMWIYPTTDPSKVGVFSVER
jgi:hypothetical protein